MNAAAPPTAVSEVARYPRALRLLHWALALSIALQLALILVLRQLQSVDFANLVLSLHRSCGTAVWLLVVARLAIGTRVRPPKSLAATPHWQALAARAVHAVLIAILLIQPLLGLMSAWSRGDEVLVLGLVKLPQLLTFTTDQGVVLKLLHRWTAYALLGLTGIHLAAVVFNSGVRKLPAMERMLAAQPANRLVNRVPLTVQLALCCGAILVLCAAAGLYSADQYKLFSDARDRFDEVEVATLDDMRVAHLGLKSLPARLGPSPPGTAAFADKARRLESEVDAFQGRATDPEVRAAVAKADAALKAAIAGAPGGLAVADQAFGDAVDSQTNAVLQGRLKMREFAARGHDLIILVLAPTVMLGAVLAFLLSRSVLAALSRARAVVHGVERGVAGEEIRVVGSGEFAQLMRDTIRMRDTVEARQQAAAARQMEQQSQIELERLAKQAAEQASKAKSDFLAIMSHEIRTPMNGVLGMVQAMERGELVPEQRARLEVIGQSGEALLTILNDILDLSKIEAGKLDLEDAEFDLERLVMATHAGFAAVAEKNGVELGLEIALDAGGVYRGDPVRLRQILSNLVSNALKFTPEGRVGINVTRTDARVRFVIADTGVGIPSDRIGLLFDKFVQADSSTTRKFGGTGLGLAICRELCEAMGGTVTAKSEVGQGSTFVVDLPLTRIGEAEAPATHPDEADLSGRPLRILAAEDNSVNRLVLTTLLAQAGVEPVVVENGQQAVDAWEAGDWDVILMDVQMPVMDGPTATRVIRRREAETGRGPVPIIALTANAMTHQSESYRAAGMNGLVAKPIKVQELFAAIVSASGGPSAPADATPDAAAA